MFKKNVFAAMVGLATAAFAVSPANALTLTAGDLKFTINNYDSGTVGYPVSPANGMVCNSVSGCDVLAQPPTPYAYGADTWGIFSIDSITSISSGATLWNSGGGEYLTGLFGGLKDAYVENATSILTGLTVTALSTGGWLNLYRNTADYNPALGPAGRTGEYVYTGITSGTLMLSTVFAGSAIAGLNYTYYSQYKPGSSYAGSGQGFLDVTGGEWFDLLNTDALTDTAGGKRDLFLDVTYNDVNGVASKLGWTVTSVGQVKGNAIPEPGSVALAGLGLLGLAALRRRKQA